VDVSTVRAAIGTSKSGLRALFAWGYANQGVQPNFMVLKPDGEAIAGPTPLNQTPNKWECLSVIPSRTDMGVSTVGHDKDPLTYPMWHAYEVNETGGVTFVLKVEVTTKDMGCPTVATTPKGYTMAWQNADGTFFADMDTTVDQKIPITIDIVKGSVRFGGPAKQPPVACIAAMGKDYGIAYAAKLGPQVDRFTFQGNPTGKSLFLPSRGNPGPVSAWPGVDAFYATYLDPDSTRGNLRYFVKVACPATR